MVSVTIFLVLAFVVFILLVFAFRSNGSSREEVIKPVRGDELAVWPFEPMPIMTPTEVIFFNRLQQAVPELIIFGQVQLSRIIMPNDDDDTDQGFWFNRICRMSVDYVLVDQDKQTVLLAIELDDWTHNTRRRQQQDEKKDKALLSAGISILRINGEAMPDAAHLRRKILAVIG